MIKHALTCIDCLTRRISTITRPGALHYHATAASTTVLPIPFASTETHLADHALMSRTNGKPSVVTSGGCEGDGQLGDFLFSKPNERPHSECLPGSLLTSRHSGRTRSGRSDEKTWPMNCIAISNVLVFDKYAPFRTEGPRLHIPSLRSHACL